MQGCPYNNSDRTENLSLSTFPQKLKVAAWVVALLEWKACLSYFLRAPKLCLNTQGKGIRERSTVPTQIRSNSSWEMVCMPLVKWFPRRQIFMTLFSQLPTIKRNIRQTFEHAKTKQCLQITSILGSLENDLRRLKTVFFLMWFTHLMF